MISSNVSLKNQSAVVTGATSGIGLGAAVVLAEAGALVIGVGRNPQRCDQAVSFIKQRVPEANIRYLLADLSRQKDIRKLAEAIKVVLQGKGLNHLDILVNNAGIYSGKYIRTEDGIELTLAVNHLAPFLLTHDLYPLLTKAPNGRVITVSSKSHYNTWIHVERINKPWIYIGFWEYKVSKLANVLFTFELNRRLAGKSMRAFAVDPGLVNTEIGMKDTRGLTYRFWNNRRKKGQDIEVPARTILHLCSENSLQDKDIYWRDCKPKTPNRQALDLNLARKLWEISASLCKVDETLGG